MAARRRVALVYNPTAGEGVSAGEVHATIASAGHEVACVFERLPDLARVLASGVDCVVVAGGDGTVARAATALAGSGVPLAIVPLGTANNIARTLGLTRGLEALARQFHEQRKVALDLGIVRGPWGEEPFVEAVGAGFVTRGIAVMDGRADGDEGSPDENLARALRTYHDVLDTLEPRPTTLVIDGERIDDDILSVEVLNMRAIGAGLVLARGADPADGRLDVVVVTEEHRRELAEYLRRRIEGAEPDVELALPVRRAEHVVLRGWDQVHLDDNVHTLREDATVDIRVRRAAVDVLLA